MQAFTGRSTARSVVLTLTLIGMAGCSAAPPSASPSPSPLPSASPVSTEPSLPLPTASPSPAPTLVPSPTPLPPVGAAPAGPWTSVAWIDAGSGLSVAQTNVAVRGWTGGYVAIRTAGGDSVGDATKPLAISTQSSADGLHWSAAADLDVTGLDSSIQVAGLAEGPDGLLMFGEPFGDTCGGPPTIVALWSSHDARTWHRLPMPKAFASNSVETMSGGSAGFIATGHLRNGTTPAIWLSDDGAAWRAAPLPRVSSGQLVVNDAASFAGGLVVGGAILGPGECGGPSRLHPTVWWSADGQRWTQESLPGASSSANATVRLVRLSDHTVAAFESTDAETDLAWVSTDGRSWQSVPSLSTTAEYGMVTGGRHAVVIIQPDGGSGPATVVTFDDRLTATMVAQTGQVPMASPDAAGWIFAVGPTGILVVREDGGRLWLGVPSST